MELIKSVGPHKVFLVKKGVVLHDTGGIDVTREEIVDATLEALKLPGSLRNGDFGPEGGVMLQNDRLNHYHVTSVDPDFMVSSVIEMKPKQTQKIVRDFLRRRSPLFGGKP